MLGEKERHTMKFRQARITTNTSVDIDAFNRLDFIDTFLRPCRNSLYVLGSSLIRDFPDDSSQAP
jgi:hypothetical protein